MKFIPAKEFTELVVFFLLTVTLITFLIVHQNLPVLLSNFGQCILLKVFFPVLY